MVVLWQSKDIPPSSLISRAWRRTMLSLKSWHLEIPACFRARKDAKITWSKSKLKNCDALGRRDTFIQFENSIRKKDSGIRVRLRTKWVDQVEGTYLYTIAEYTDVLDPRQPFANRTNVQQDPTKDLEVERWRSTCPAILCNAILHGIA